MNFLTDFLFPNKININFEKLPRANFIEEDVSALLEYQHPEVKKLVWEIKYGGSRELAQKSGELMAELLASELEERGLWGEDEVYLTPIPISPQKLFDRGWNQAELLAKNMKGFQTLPVLEKIHDTNTQKDVGGRSARLKNLVNSMRATLPEPMSNKCIVVIDDVVTTGATFTEARRALKEVGVSKVICLALAH